MAVAGPHEATPLVSKRFSPPLVSTLKQPPPVFTYKRSRQLLFSLFTISPRAVNFSFFFFGRFQALNINSLLYGLDESTLHIFPLSGYFIQSSQMKELASYCNREQHKYQLARHQQTTCK